MALSIFITYDVMFHCFHYGIKVYTMWLTLSFKFTSRGLWREILPGWVLCRASENWPIHWSLNTFWTKCGPIYLLVTKILNGLIIFGNILWENLPMWKNNVCENKNFQEIWPLNLIKNKLCKEVDHLPESENETIHVLQQHLMSAKNSLGSSQTSSIHSYHGYW